MKERGEKLIGQKAKDGATMNFVSRQAQEAILDPNLPESYKDEVLDAAVGTLLRIAEKRNAYNARLRESRRLKRSHMIYEAGDDEGEERENTPPIIVELNENLKNDTPEDTEGFTVEGIAERVGINKNILYEWVKSDSEFTTALERLKDVQKDDPFKTGTDEDTFVNSMMIAILLLETKDRHHKSTQL